jgi:Protein of unknown function (DUF2934)
MSTRPKSKRGNQPAPDAIEKQSESVDPSAGVAPAHHEIQPRAYSIHVERGGRHGCDLEDWLKAERELTEEQPAAPTGNDGDR